MRLREKISKEELGERVPRRPSRDQIVSKMHWRGQRTPEVPASRTSRVRDSVRQELSGVMETLRQPFERMASRSREQARRRRRRRFGVAAIGAAVAGFGAYLFSRMAHGMGRGAESGLEAERAAEAAKMGTEGTAAEPTTHESNGHRTEQEATKAP
jgi:hypothetical protein